MDSPNSILLYISCRDLVDLDVVGKSDPFAVLFIKCEKDTDWSYLGKTEVCWNNLNPDFLKNFKVNYYFEKNLLVRIEIYDHDDDEENDLIGFYEQPLNKLLTASKQTIKA